MLNIRSSLREAFLDALLRAQEVGELPAVDPKKVFVQYPPPGQDEVCEYASPIALLLGKELQKNPLDVAGIILKHLQLPEYVERIDAVAPGFLNIRIKPSWMTKKLDDVVEDGAAFGGSSLGSGNTMNLEFVSANPTGLPTFGNGRALFWADSLGRVLSLSGYAVTREYYVNDVGNQVNVYGESVLRRILERRGLAVEFPEGLYQGEDVKEIARMVEERIAEDTGHVFSEGDLSDAAFLKRVAAIAVEETVRAIREVMEELCKVHFDVWMFEHTLHEEGKVREALDDLKQKGVTYEKDGALWFASTQFGDDKDRVLVRENGEVTYFVADIAYHREKLRRGFSAIADFWGADHHGYIPRLAGALQALGEDNTKLHVVIAQMVSIVEAGEQKKMSKRAGTSLPLHEMVMKSGLSAARFFLTMKALGSHMEFDVDLAQEQSDRNPVYYVQYAHVRLASLLRKAHEGVGDAAALTVSGALVEPAERILMRTLLKFPEVVEDVALSWDIQRLPHYAIELARAIHVFYDAVPILSAESDEQKAGRLLLVQAAKTALGNTLDLLGVEKRDVM